MLAKEKVFSISAKYDWLIRKVVGSSEGGSN